MIHFVKGNLFDSNADALVNTINIVGVMGKGIALECKKKYPYNFKMYYNACKQNKIQIGKMFVIKESNKFIINFPTKKHWRNPSKIEYHPGEKSGGGFLMDVENAKEELGYEPVYDVHKLFENYKEEMALDRFLELRGK